MNDFQRGRFYLVEIHKRTGMHTIHNRKPANYGDCVGIAQCMGKTVDGNYKMLFKVHHDDRGSA